MHLDLAEAVWKLTNKMLINVCNIKNIHIIQITKRSECVVYDSMNCGMFRHQTSVKCNEFCLVYYGPFKYYQ